VEKEGRKRRKKWLGKQKKKNSRRTAAKEVLEIEESIQKSKVKENASEKDLEPCDKVKERFCA